MKTWNRLIAVGGEEGGEKWWKKGGGFSQRTCVNDSWTWTTKRRLWERGVGGLGGGGLKGKNWDNCNRIINNKKETDMLTYVLNYLSKKFLDIPTAYLTSLFFSTLVLLRFQPLRLLCIIKRSITSYIHTWVQLF